MSIDTETIWKILGLVFAAGAFWQELKAIRKDISRLEEKVEKHNSFDRRIVRLESIIEEKELQNTYINK